jgi:hypothetical protein
MGTGKPKARSWKVKSVSTNDGDNDEHGTPVTIQSSSTPTSSPKWKPSTTQKAGIPSSVATPSPASKWKPHPPDRSSSAKKSEEPSDQGDSQASLSVDSLQKGESDYEVDLEPEVEAPTKEDSITKKDTQKKATNHYLNRLWKSSSGLDYSDVVKPNPSAFIATRQVRRHQSETFEKIQRPDATAFRNAMWMEQNAGASHIDEYLPSAHDHAGSRKRGEPVRKWKPSATKENSRPDEWMGTGKPKARSWKVKSVSTNDGEKDESGIPVTIQSSSTPTASPKWNPSTTQKAGIPLLVTAPSPAFKWKPHSPDRSSSAKKGEEPSDHGDSLASLSAGSLQKGESDFEVDLESEAEAPTKEDAITKKDTQKQATNPHHNRMWKSSSEFDYSDVVKPDPSAFIAMRQVRQGDTNRCDEFLPSANPYGTPGRKKKTEPVRKWKPSATTENSRPDEWMGGGKPKARSWKVKSVSTNKPPENDSDGDIDDDDGEKDKAPDLGVSKPSEWKPKPVVQKVEPAPAPAQSPAAEPKPQAVSNDNEESKVLEVESDTEVEIESEDEEEPAKTNQESSPKKEAPAKPKPPKKHELPKVGMIEKPDAESFRNAMRQEREGETMRVEGFLPSANPFGTSPRKRGDPVKKWKPTSTTENSRPDEWMGSGKKPKARSWTVKSVSTTKPASSPGGNDSE